ncbi:MAG: 1,4-alpha-glucan branching protein GlgB [Gammaproteobacteria bacterium]|nr:1,4-alpha-glucan branching protein GlgB [Gammaproteobacteria bacterium]
MSEPTTPTPATDLQRLAAATHDDPFAFLGPHRRGDQIVLRCFMPAARALRVVAGPTLERVPGSDLFIWRGAANQLPGDYELQWTDTEGTQHRGQDPYRFGPLVGEFDRQVFGEGRHWHVHRFLGTNLRTASGVEGVLFATWAPNARRVSVVGDFNRWDGRCHPLRHHPGGIWEIFLPGVDDGARYKFEILGADGSLALKTDPYARAMELRPQTAAVVSTRSSHRWQDQAWMAARVRSDWLHRPCSIYELHAGSWRRRVNGDWLSWEELTAQLIPYVRELGYTHIELMPVMEHPLDASWGYQTLGYFAPTARHGSPDAFRAFVDACHQAGIGVLLDWTPAHFPSDAHGLARFDGTPLYEHGDPRRGRHPDWGSLVFDYGRPEVRNFLLASALSWLQDFHIDGLRVDAVASMLYLDYSRQPGEWLPNRYGGRENLEAIELLQQLNHVVHQQFPGALVIAEESTAWPQVTRPTWLGGLGFSMKWNMGWMHDTLDYLRHDPIHRSYHQQQLTFGLMYAHHENFVLPLSHDEVVHGKGSLLAKMPGDDWQRFANLRLLYVYQWTYPGKKLLFMGQEFGQRAEWNHNAALDWALLDHSPHRGVRQLLIDLNRLHRAQPPLHVHDFDAEGFEWIDCNDAQQSVLSYLRRGAGEVAVVVLNFTPVPRCGYRLGVPLAGRYRELLNSDAGVYGGSGGGNLGGVHSQPQPWMGRAHSLVLNLPPLGGLILVPDTSAAG